MIKILETVNIKVFYFFIKNLNLDYIAHETNITMFIN